jgi:hypothetical protein
MDLQKFRSCLSQSEPPKNLSLAVQALWWDAKGDWDKAHACAQVQDDADGAWVHAYLHRKEGDTNKPLTGTGAPERPSPPYRSTRSGKRLQKP